MRNKTFRLLYWLLLMAVLLGACNLPALQAGQLPQTGNQPGIDSRQIGIVSREADLVEQGRSVEDLQPVIDPRPLQVGDLLRVSQGGSARIEFTEKMQILLFNDSQTGLSAASPPDTPPAYELILQRGGIYGELKESGGKFELVTPTGVKISVLGTRFFVVYDEGERLTTVGNFDGLLGVSSNGSDQVLPPGTFVDAPAEGPPGPLAPIPVTVEQFDQWARDNGSSLIAVELMRAEPTPSFTPPSTPAQTATLTGTPVSSATPTSTSTPAPSSTPASSPTPTTSSTPTLPGPPTAQVIRSAGCRSGPGSIFDLLIQFPRGQQLAIAGRLADRSWWLVRIPNRQTTCWIWENNVRLSGDLSQVPVLPAPATPTATNTATPTPTGVTITPTHTATPTTVTPHPPTITFTPTVTDTPVPPTDTDTPVPPTITDTPVPPTPTDTPVTPAIEQEPPVVEFSSVSTQICRASELAEVIVRVTDQSSIISVSLGWSIGDESGNSSMSLVDPFQGGGYYRGEAGPVGTIGEMTVAVTAMDLYYNSSAPVSTTVAVIDCSQQPG